MPIEAAVKLLNQRTPLEGKRLIFWRFMDF